MSDVYPAKGTNRTLGLTQAGATVICDVCDGVGAVLALAVEEPLNVDGLDGGGLAVREAKVVPFEVMIPCPGCFMGTKFWAVEVSE